MEIFKILSLYEKVTLKDVSYCCLCFHTENERRMVIPKAMQEFMTMLSIDFSEWKNMQACYMCESRALNIMLLVQAASAAQSVQDILTKMASDCQYRSKLTLHLMGAVKSTEDCFQKVRTYEREVNKMRSHLDLTVEPALLVDAAMQEMSYKGDANQKSPKENDDAILVIDDESDVESISSKKSNDPPVIRKSLRKRVPTDRLINKLTEPKSQKSICKRVKIDKNNKANSNNTETNKSTVNINYDKVYTTKQMKVKSIISIDDGELTTTELDSEDEIDTPASTDEVEAEMVLPDSPAILSPHKDKIKVAIDNDVRIINDTDAAERTSTNNSRKGSILIDAKITAGGKNMPVESQLVQINNPQQMMSYIQPVISWPNGSVQSILAFPNMVPIFVNPNLIQTHPNLIQSVENDQILNIEYSKEAVDLEKPKNQFLKVRDINQLTNPTYDDVKAPSPEMFDAEKTMDDILASKVRELESKNKSVNSIVDIKSVCGDKDDAQKVSSVDWEDKIPMDVISYVDAVDPNYNNDLFEQAYNKNGNVKTGVPTNKSTEKSERSAKKLIKMPKSLPAEVPTAQGMIIDARSVTKDVYDRIPMQDTLDLT